MFQTVKKECKYCKDFKLHMYMHVTKIFMCTMHARYNTLLCRAVQIRAYIYTLFKVLAHSWQL